MVSTALWHQVPRQRTSKTTKLQEKVLHFMELSTSSLRLLYLLSFISIATTFLTQCEAKGLGQHKSSLIRSSRKPRPALHLELSSSSDPYSSSAVTYPPFCVNPPLTPLPPSPMPTPTIPMQSPPPSGYYSPPILSPFPPETVPGPPTFLPGPPAYGLGPPTFAPGPTPSVPIQSPPPSPLPPAYYSPPILPPYPPEIVPGPPTFVPGPPTFVPGPPTYLPSPPAFVPGPPLFLPPVVYPPPLAPPPPAVTLPGLWCVAKPTVPDPITQVALDYACASGADCDSIQLGGECFQPDTVLAHASYAFNSYWQRTKVAGGTCDFGGTAMLITIDPSYDGCHFILM